MSQHQNPADQARTALLDATVIATIGDQARANMIQNTGGFSATTPGASPADAQGDTECGNDDCDLSRPCPIHDPDSTQILTSTERLASQRDRAQADLQVYDEAGRKAAHQLAVQARIATRWGYNGITQTDVKQRLIAIDATIWCANCGRHGYKNPRLEDQTECEFCADFRRDYKRPAPKEVLEIRSYRRLSIQDIERVLDRVDPGWRKKRGKRTAA